MFTTIQNSQQIAESQSAFEKRVIDSASESGNIKVGYQGGGQEVTAHYFRGNGFWVAMEDARGRYWNALGIGNPFEGDKTIVAEINPPKSGINRRVSGVFVRDETGKVYFAHRGRVGGGRKGIGKKAFLDWYTGKIFGANDGERDSDIIIIGALEDPNLIQNLAAFTRDVATFKEQVVANSLSATPPPARIHSRSADSSGRFLTTVVRAKSERVKHLARFYRIINALQSRIGKPRKLTDCSGFMNWPTRGVYFFMEEGERRSDSGDGPRIVRVGTHALKAGANTTLWTRLSQHKGVAKDGGGNHRGSIFRLIVGTALYGTNPEYMIDSWGQGSSAPKDVRDAEVDLERKVSETIGQMPFIWIPIEDEPGPQSARGDIERNSIRLLSNFEKPPLDPPSEHWLGCSCDRDRVRRSGIWNSNHVDEPYDPTFLDRFAKLVINLKS